MHLLSLEIVYKIGFIFDEIPIFVKSFSVHMSKIIMRAPCGGPNLKIGIKGAVVVSYHDERFHMRTMDIGSGVKAG